MRDLDRLMEELSDNTADTGYQFLVTEVQSCTTCIDIALYELEAGNLMMARHELENCKIGIGEILRFLPRIRPHQQATISARLAELQAAYQDCRAKVEVAGTSPIA